MRTSEPECWLVRRPARPAPSALPRRDPGAELGQAPVQARATPEALAAVAALAPPVVVQVKARAAAPIQAAAHTQHVSALHAIALWGVCT